MIFSVNSLNNSQYTVYSEIDAYRAQFAFMGELHFTYFYSFVFKTSYPVTIKKLSGINNNLINNLRDKEGNPLYHF